MFPAPGTGYGSGFGGNAPAGSGGANREVRYRVVVTGDTTQAQQSMSQLATAANQAANAARSVAPYAMLPSSGPRSAYTPGFSAVDYNNAYASMYGRSLLPPGPDGAGSSPGPAGGAAGGGAMAGVMAGFQTALGMLNTTLTTTVAAILALGQASNAATLSLRNSVSARAKLNEGIGAIPLIGGLVNSAVNPVLDAREVYGNQGVYVKRGIESGVAAGAYHRARAEKGWWGRQWQDTWFDFDKVGSVMASAAAMAAMDQDAIFESQFARDRGAIRQRQEYAAEDLDYGDQLMGRNAAVRTRLGRDQARLLFAPEDTLVGPDPRRQSFDSNSGYDAVIRQAVRERAGAEAGLGAARNEYQLARGQRLNSDLRQRLGRKEYDDAQAVAGGMAEAAKTDASVNLELQKAIADAQEKQAKWMAEVQRYQEMVNREKRAGLAVTEREHELAQRQLDVDRARLEVLERKRERLKGFAEQFGTMDPMRQQSVLNVVERAKANSFQSLTPEEKELLLGTGATQDFAKERARKAAFDSPQFQQVLRAVGLQDQQALDAEIAKVKRKVEVEFEMNEEKFEKQLKEVIDRMKPLVDEALLRVTKAQLQGVELRRIASFVTGGVGGG